MRFQSHFRVVYLWYYYRTCGWSTFTHVRANGRCPYKPALAGPVLYSLFLGKRVEIRKTGKLKGLKSSSSSSSYPFRRLKGSQLRNPTLTDRQTDRQTDKQTDKQTKRQTDADDYCNPLAHAHLILHSLEGTHVMLYSIM